MAKKTNLVSVKTLKDPVNKNHMFWARWKDISLQQEGILYAHNPMSSSKYYDTILGKVEVEVKCKLWYLRLELKMRTKSKGQNQELLE